MQVFRSEVGAVGPSKRMPGYRERPEVLDVPQRFKYRAVQRFRKIDLGGGSIIEPYVYLVSHDVFGVGNMYKHDSTPVVRSCSAVAPREQAPSSQ